MPKYSDTSVNPEEWSTKKLITDYKGLYDVIYRNEPCYGVRNLVLIGRIEKELDKRGYEFHEETILKITKRR